MRSTTTLLALAATLSPSLAAYQGFNYGAANTDGSFRFEADFEAEFRTAKNLVGTSGFSSARLYTMIQGGSSTNEPIQAIPAAITTDTSLLLGLWASGGEGFFQAEITALRSAIAKWGDDFTSRVVGISVGSEDLYRISPTGIAAGSGYGADPATVARYISELRSALQGTSLSSAPIGHVDTWTAWVNSTNQAVIDASDWIGFDAYPYFQNTQSNGIENGKALFQAALDATKQAVGSKEVWITETGWPVSGKTQNLAVPSTENAKTYWDEVGCPLFGNVNTWWFTLQDSNPTTPNPSFGIVGNPLSNNALFDLSCSAITTSSSSSAAPSTTAAPSSTGGAGSGGSASASAAGSAVASGSTVASVSPSSIVSSDDSQATESPVVSSGDGLSPSQGAGIGPGSSFNTSATEVTGSLTTLVAGPSGNVSVPNGGAQPTVSLTTATTVVGGTGAGGPAATSTGPAVVTDGNGAATLSGSLIGAVVALLAAVAAL